MNYNTPSQSDNKGPAKTRRPRERNNKPPRKQTVNAKLIGPCHDKWAYLSGRFPFLYLWLLDIGGWEVILIGINKPSRQADLIYYSLPDGREHEWSTKQLRERWISNSLKCISFSLSLIKHKHQATLVQHWSVVLQMPWCQISVTVSHYPAWKSHTTLEK